MDYLEILTAVCTVALVGVVLFLSYRQGTEAKEVHETLSKLAKNAGTSIAPSPEIGARMAQLERRMEVLEEDVTGYLKKANTRLARAKKLADKREEDEEEDENAQIYEQIPIPGIDAPNGSNGPTVWDEDEALAQVKAAMRQR